MSNLIQHLFVATLGSILISVMASCAGISQNSVVILPIISDAAVPLYPPIARAAGIQGVVRVTVTTDGERVASIDIEGGHQVLSAAAVQNLQTWRFAKHDPTTFSVSYRYTLDPELQGNPDNPVVILRLPTEVEIIRTPFNTRDLPSEVR